MKETENIGHGKDYDGSEFFGGGSNNTARDFGGDSDRSFETPDIDTTELSSTESAFESESNPIAESMKDLIRGSTTEQANSNTGNSIDTAFQIGDINDDLEKKRQDAERLSNEFDKANEDFRDFEKVHSEVTGKLNEYKDRLASIDKSANPFGKSKDYNKLVDEMLDDFSSFTELGSDFLDKITRNASPKEIIDEARSIYDSKLNEKKTNARNAMAARDSAKADYSEAMTSSMGVKDKSTPSEVLEGKGPGDKMKNAKTSASDYLTSANKDAPKTARDTHDNFLSHGEQTLAGAMDRMAKTTTDLGIKDLKAWAEENGKDPSKLSTMRAYNVYQTKEIVKAIPGVMKEVGSYIEERVKDAFDPSKLGTRVANTLARYNAASLIGAAILSLKYGSNFTEALDMALSSVDPADVPEVREALENALNDDSLVDDISILIDDAYSNMNSSKQGDIDSEIVNIGRKNNTDYSDFNAGLGTSSDKDVKVFITRNVKSDPVLRALVKKLK